MPSLADQDASDYADGVVAMGAKGGRPAPRGRMEDVRMTEVPPTETLRDRAVQIYDAFTHEHHDRRTLLRQMTALAGSAAAAEARDAPSPAAELPAADSSSWVSTAPQVGRGEKRPSSSAPEEEGRWQ